MIKSIRMRQAWHLASMGEIRDAYRVLVWKPERKRHLGRTRRRWEDNSKMDIQDIRWRGGAWTGLIWLRTGRVGGLW